MRFTLFAAAALVALGQPIYAQDTAQKNAESADTQAQMEADGKKTQSQDKPDTKTAEAEASRHMSRRPGANGGGMNSNAGNNNGNAADQLDPMKGSTTGTP
jgi:nitric oxide reductase activation protein